ncbi:MAG: hypothetical protein ACI9K3_000639 [Halovenus sp.]|jgi:hypothetical protein
MGEERTSITVAETSNGPGGSRSVGESVSLPVVELLTGRGFITGKSGSGKSNSASVVAERLLDNELGLLIVDIDGEYYGLKEEYEILHAGGDEECDIQVTTDHAEKLAGLALEQNVPIILDVSSYLDESVAERLLTAVARSLFAKAKKQKQPFLLLVEEIHEYIPEQGSVGECGQMLIKIGKRGRKHGLGLCGVSQRPADVKKDFITQCDWLLWHRLTWQNDTRVVRRILDGTYADAVESLDDGEGFLVTDWTDDVRRVQFHRKQTFDAGATPGLEDVERPALKSVSEDLVAELAEITDEATARADRIAELEAELDRRETRIEELERELRDARNLRGLAEQFVDALTSHPSVADDHRRAVRDGSGDRPTHDSRDETTGSAAQTTDQDAESVSSDTERVELPSVPAWPGGWREPGHDRVGHTDTDETPDETATAEPVDDSAAESRLSARRLLSKLAETPDPRGDGSPRADTREAIEREVYSGVALAEAGATGADETHVESDSTDGGVADDTTGVTGKTGSNTETETEPVTMPDEEPLVVRELKAEVGGLETVTRRMLAFYREEGPASAQNAHFAAGGGGDRTRAYAHNRTLRTRGLVVHVGRGRYDYHLRDRLAEKLGDHADPAVVEAYATEIEETTLAVD